MQRFRVMEREIVTLDRSLVAGGIARKRLILQRLDIAQLPARPLPVHAQYRDSSALFAVFPETCHEPTHSHSPARVNHRGPSQR